MKLQNCINKVFLFVCVFLASCSGTENQTDVLSMVNDWTGREITFPESPVFTIQDRDTVLYDFYGSPYKILTYIDAKECISCNFDLKSWMSFISEMDSTLQVRVPIIFYFGTPHTSEVKHITRSEKFDYPICIDRDDQLNALNKFPESRDFHTFLLDKENKIVAIGSPASNVRIKDLYMGIIQGKEVAEDNNLTTMATLSDEKLDLGTIPFAEETHRTFRISNIGSNRLVVYDIQTSCGCTEVTYSKEPVSIGEDIEVSVVYKPDQRGAFNKTLSIYSNGSEFPLVVTISGNVE
ncbi:MAG: DUF1573 domain-containing protein [Bacteroidales bacterium]|nr:DUF1573 domain-containing protein [Bacteroidales bacterium]